jgi:UDP-glucose 4-epimerase
VRDTVRAIWQLAGSAEAVGEIYNIGSQEEITIGALAERVLERTGSRAGIHLVPYDEAYEKGFEDMQRRVPSIAKIRAAIGWAPTVGLNETLDEVIAHFRAEKAANEQ